MGLVGSVAMGLPWKGRGRGSVCWVGSVSSCWVLPWKGRGRGSVCWVGSLGLAVERKWQRIGEGRRSGIVKGKAIRVVMEVWYGERESCLLGRIVGSCCGKEMAENRRRQKVWYRERESYSCGHGGKGKVFAWLWSLLSGIV